MRKRVPMKTVAEPVSTAHALADAVITAMLRADSDLVVRTVALVVEQFKRQQRYSRRRSMPPSHRCARIWESLGDRDCTGSRPGGSAAHISAGAAFSRPPFPWTCLAAIANEASGRVWTRNVCRLNVLGNGAGSCHPERTDRTYGRRCPGQRPSRKHKLAAFAAGSVQGRRTSLGMRAGHMNGRANTIMDRLIVASCPPSASWKSGPGFPH